MKWSGLSALLLAGSVVVSAHSQESDEPQSAESVRAQVCAEAGVDLSMPESDLSRSQRRALRRCTDRAEAMVAQGDGAEPDSDDGVICRRESVVGTHRRIRICTTRAEREAMRNSSREVIRDITRPGGDFGNE